MMPTCLTICSISAQRWLEISTVAPVAAGMSDEQRASPECPVDPDRSLAHPESAASAARSSAMAMPACCSAERIPPDPAAASCVRCTMSSTRPMSCMGYTLKSATIPDFPGAVRCRYPAGTQSGCRSAAAAGGFFGQLLPEQAQFGPPWGGYFQQHLHGGSDLPALFGPMNPYTHPAVRAAPHGLRLYGWPVLLAHRPFVSIMASYNAHLLLSVWPYATPCALNEL